MSMNMNMNSDRPGDYFLSSRRFAKTQELQNRTGPFKTGCNVTL